MIFEVAFDTRTLIFILSFLIVIVTFVYVGIKTLKRNPSNRTNQIFAIFFFATSIALAFNIPAPFMVDDVRKVLIIITAYGVSVSIGILLIFTFVLYFSNKIVTDKRKWTIACLFALIFVGYFFIPNGVFLDTSTGVSVTRYSTELAVYFLIGTQTAYVLILWFAAKAYKNFTDQAMQKRFRYFLFGLVCFEIMLFLTPLLNAGWVPPEMQFLLFFALPGAILIYLGVGKHL
jgi:hypothetical protein